MHLIELTTENVTKRSVIHLLKYVAWKPEYVKYMTEMPGKEIYKMLVEISHQLPNGSKIADVGTYIGASALALSSNPNVNVTTYDIVGSIPNDAGYTALTRDNVVQKVISGQEDIENISNSELVVLDIDPHDGPSEVAFVKLLLDKGFKGILVCDNVKLNEGMQEFWNSIPSHLKKIDVSQLAHWTGTGIVVFDPSYIDVQV